MFLSPLFLVSPKTIQAASFLASFVLCQKTINIFKPGFLTIRSSPGATETKVVNINRINGFQQYYIGSVQWPKDSQKMIVALLESFVKGTYIVGNGSRKNWESIVLSSVYYDSFIKTTSHGQFWNLNGLDWHFLEANYPISNLNMNDCTCQPPLDIRILIKQGVMAHQCLTQNPFIKLLKKPFRITRIEHEPLELLDPKDYSQDYSQTYVDKDISLEQLQSLALEENNTSESLLVDAPSPTLLRATVVNPRYSAMQEPSIYSNYRMPVNLNKMLLMVPKSTPSVVLASKSSNWITSKAIDKGLTRKDIISEIELKNFNGSFSLAQVKHEQQTSFFFFNLLIGMLVLGFAISMVILIKIKKRKSVK